MRVMRWFVPLVCFLLPLAGRAADSWHTFTDVHGRKLEAKVLQVEGDFAIVELKSNGRQLPIEFEKLSEEDVEYLENWEEPDDKAPAGKAGVEGGDVGEPEIGRLYPRGKEQIRSGIREIKRRPKPDGISREVFDATTQLNIYRFLCGVPFDVEADAEFSAKAGEAAIACKKHGGLSHDIGHFTNRCNLSGGGDMARSVAGYIEDSGENNRERRGHRAWCLNPPMKRVGFGSAGASYSAMWCMNNEGKSLRGAWSYPGMGLFPLEYMHGNAWSLYGAGKPDAADKVKIEMFRLLKRPEKPFSATAEIPGRPVKINYVSLAMNGINFEPETPAERGVYWIRVRGGGIREAYLVELY